MGGDRIIIDKKTFRNPSEIDDELNEGVIQKELIDRS